MTASNQELSSNLTATMKKIVSDKPELFTESVIREMTRQANLYGAINLSQGFPDFAAPEEIKQAAIAAINADINQYAITWGAKSFRDAIVEKSQWYLGLDVDPEREITVTCGSTEAMMAAMMAITNPGDEVIVFEPFYENYGPDAILSSATPRYVTMYAPDWSFDKAELEAAFNNHTKAIIINTPNNPTGKIFSREEMEFIASLCQKWNVIAITDEIYEHILFNGKEHIAMATIDGMKDQTITINGLSKTYSVTGWRVGYAIARPDITQAIRKVHDFLTVGAAAPLQEAGAHAIRLPPGYY
jgi:aminotransferase